MPADFDFEMMRQGYIQQQMQFPHIMAKKAYQQPLIMSNSKNALTTFQPLSNGTQQRNMTADPVSNRIRANLPPVRESFSK